MIFSKNIPPFKIELFNSGFLNGSALKKISQENTTVQNVC